MPAKYNGLVYGETANNFEPDGHDAPRIMRN